MPAVEGQRQLVQGPMQPLGTARLGLVRVRHSTCTEMHIMFKAVVNSMWSTCCEEALAASRF